ncbi:MAG: DUF4115 domain-containing protein [Desulfosalsimonadaceae bacterium]|nr:DUF4115 domain-containing protein [Desulfosalsimonadaceae bacterium]
MNDHIIMNPDPRAMPFGRYLKAIRLQQGISLEEVAYETQISLRKLMLIEEEDHDQLPEAGQVQSLLRIYAKWIGVDEDDIVDRYEINRSFFYQTENPDDVPSKRGKRFYLRLSLALVFLIVVAGLSAYIYNDYRTHQPEAAGNAQAEETIEVKKEPAVKAEPQAAAEVATEKPLEPSAAVIPPEPTGKLFLKIDAIEETMIKIGVDDADLVAYLLNPKDHIELEASTRIRLEVGNPGGVKVFLNDEPVAINGKSGEIVTLELTHPK